LGFLCLAVPATATTDYNTDYDRNTVIYKHFRHTVTPLLCKSHESAEILCIVCLPLIFIIVLLTTYYNRKIIQIKAIQMKLVANILTYRNCPVDMTEMTGGSLKRSLGMACYEL